MTFDAQLDAMSSPLPEQPPVRRVRPRVLRRNMTPPPPRPRNVQAKLPGPLWEKLDARATEAGVSRAEVVREALEQHLRRTQP